MPLSDEARHMIEDLRYELTRKIDDLEREVDQLRRRLGTDTREHDA